MRDNLEIMSVASVIIRATINKPRLDNPSKRIRFSSCINRQNSGAIYIH